MKPTICMLDTFGSRLGASGHVLHEVPSLLSDQHWRDLAAMMADDTLRSLIIASPTVMLDDSPDDAVLKACFRAGGPFNLLNSADITSQSCALISFRFQSTGIFPLSKLQRNSAELSILFQK